MCSCVLYVCATFVLLYVYVCMQCKYCICVYLLFVCLWVCVCESVCVCVCLFQEQWEEPGESGGPCNLWALPGAPHLPLGRTLCESHFSPEKPHKVTDLLHVGDKQWCLVHV